MAFFVQLYAINGMHKPDVIKNVQYSYAYCCVQKDEFCRNTHMQYNYDNIRTTCYS